MRDSTVPVRGRNTRCRADAQTHRTLPAMSLGDAAPPRPTRRQGCNKPAPTAVCCVVRTGRTPLVAGDAGVAPAAPPNADGSQPMSPTRKTLLLLATAWPPVYMVIFLVFWLSSFFAIESGSGEWMFAAMAVIFPLHALTMLMTMGLMGVYIYHTIKNPRLSENERLIWILANLIGGLMAWPVYFWLHIKDAPQNG